MTTEQVGLAVAGAVALVALAVALLAHRRARRAESLVSSLGAALAERVDPPSAPAAQAPPVADSDTAAFVITHVGEPEAAAAVPVARPIDGRLFTDIVARETVVKAAGWTHGLRRALSPESRNRIRFAVRQETKRSGRERRAEMKQALREFRARERATVQEDVA
ncbi:hypothetical protein [Nocardioides pinisoli]|uniref:Uncharacterized protein n=1 Tax=Nocardioides pinisoli TaxID=2950279 RepID=A0ABT1KUA5_9ACTN|nr:hypothetical protein [Nocardioides pinisoli]MCP3421330.1 hypothetical protein [Nocardioides pinisoli]